MNLRVQYDDLNKTGQNILEKHNRIMTTLGNMQKIVDSIPNAWKGIDSDVFTIKATGYIKDQQEKSNKVKVLGEILSIVSKNYQTRDNEWLNRMKKEK